MACGFSSPSAFIETFRAALGATPGRYQHEVLSETSAAGG
jgi:AraC-like DNA-binding protein